MASDSDPNPRFAEANKAYELGHFEAAAKQYGELIAAKHASASVWFNLGNALFKGDRKGAAIHAYLNAAHLSPRDSDVLANLGFARDKAPGANASVLAPSRPLLVPLLSVGELKLLVLALVWGWFGLWILRWAKPELGPKTSTIERLAGALALVALGIALASHAWARNRTAIVSASETAVRFGPLPESQSQFTLRDGAELRLLSTREQWVEVEDRSGKRGWVAADDVLLFP